VLHTGSAKSEQLDTLLATSKFGGQFEDPITKCIDALAEGLYLRIEEQGIVAQRAKFVRPQFVAGVQKNTRWRHQAIVPNRLVEGADIWR
jgi:hypothetical protein